VPGTRVAGGRPESATSVARLERLAIVRLERRRQKRDEVFGIARARERRERFLLHTPRRSVGSSFEPKPMSAAIRPVISFNLRK
jgi:hypothetical protein